MFCRVWSFLIGSAEHLKSSEAILLNFCRPAAAFMQTFCNLTADLQSYYRSCVDLLQIPPKSSTDILQTHCTLCSGNHLISSCGGGIRRAVLGPSWPFPMSREVLASNEQTNICRTNTPPCVNTTQTAITFPYFCWRRSLRSNCFCLASLCFGLFTLGGQMWTLESECLKDQ